MNKKNLIVIFVVIISSFIGYKQYNLYQAKKENEKNIKRLDPILTNYIKNHLKCSDEKTINDYKSMIRHYNLRVIRHNRNLKIEDQFVLLDEKKEFDKVQQHCKMDQVHNPSTK